MSLATAILLLAAGCRAHAPAPPPQPEAPPEPPPPPAPEELLREAASLAGLDTFLADHRAYALRGRVSMPAQGLAGTVEEWHQAPDRLLTIIDLPGLGRMSQGYNGEVGWATDLIRGPRRMEGGELAQTRLVADYDRELDPASVYTELRNTGEVDWLDGRAWRLEGTTVLGTRRVTYVDVATGLVRGYEDVVTSDMGEFPVTTRLLSWRAFEGGVRMPVHVEVEFMGMTQVLEFDELVVDPPEMPSFDPPAEVLALEPASGPGAPAPGGEVAPPR